MITHDIHEEVSNLAQKHRNTQGEMLLEERDNPEVIVPVVQQPA